MRGLTVLVATAVSIACLVFLAFPSQAAPAAPRAAHKARAGYQHLKPYEDLSLQEDAIEIYDRAVTAFSKQKYDEAEKLFKRVLVLTPKNADAKYNLGAIAEWHNQLDKALQFYQEALTLKPSDRDFQKAVSDVQLKMQIDLQAKENKRQENLVDAGQKAKIAFSSGDYYEAAKQLNQLVRIFPNESKVHFALGQSLRALKVYEWAAYHLKMAIYLDPTDNTYKRALVDLDQEIMLAQEQALNDSAQIAMAYLRPISAGQFADPTICGGDFR